MDVAIGRPANEVLPAHASRQDLDQIWAWNSRVPEPVNGCIHDLISDVATSQQSDTAVCAWDGSFTYAQLDALSAAVARRLLGLGVKPKSNVPICFEKTKWTPVAMLGVIKAGCAAIALDTSQPDARLRSIVQQARPTAIVSSANSSARAARVSDVTVLRLDEDILALGNETLPLPLVSPADIAYISFTSGTTGRPKGACISHSNVRSAVQYQGQKLGFHRGCRVFDFAPYSFDVAWSNFLHTICAGGCVCIAREQDMMDDLSSAITEFEATLLNVTPTILRTIHPVPPSLQTVLLSGEMPYRENITQWADQVRLLNTYGPTECTFKCAFSTIQSSQDGRPELGPGVGFCTWVVDPDNPEKLAPLGSVGELYLEGPLVGQGYLASSEPTAAAFIDSPTWLQGGAHNFPGRRGILYKTGDLVRYSTNESLSFVGRNGAAQLKIRGQRIEIGDVEHHVRTCLPAAIHVIAEAIHPRGSETAALALFIQTRGHEKEYLESSLDGLTESLPELLPAFMIPSVYFPVEDITLAATGKADRKFFRETASAMTWNELCELQRSITRATEWREPSNGTEKRILEIWAGVLGLDTAAISTTDSFLRKGGDSVAAMKMVAAARNECISLTVADVFTHPRLIDLAKVASARTGQLAPTHVLPFSLITGDSAKACHEAAWRCKIAVAQVDDIYPCTPLQQGMLAMTAKTTKDYISRTVLKLALGTDIGQLQEAWATVFKNTAILRTRIVDMPDQGLVQVVVNQPLPWNIVPSLESISDDIEPMGLGTPLCRFGVIECSDYLVLEMHHAIYDGWCKSLLLNAVKKTYHSDPDALQSLIPFRLFVNHMMYQDMTEAVAFWQDQLLGSEAPVFPSPALVPGVKMDFNHSITDLQWPSTDITPSTVIRSAITLLIGWYTNSCDIKFGATASGRQTPIAGIEQVAGPTIATTPVRVQFQWQQSVEALQTQIQHQSVQITQHEQFGLSRIQTVSPNAQEASGFQLLLVVQPAGDENTHKEADVFSYSDDIGQTASAKGQRNKLGAFNSYAMMLVCQLGESGVHMNINFDSAAIHEKEVQRIGLQLERLLRQLCSDEYSSSRVCDLSAVSDQDLEDIWQQNHLAVANTGLVYFSIDEKAKKTPKAIALSACDGEVTYQQLKAASDHLAHYLQAQGIGKGCVVMLFFEKSAWMPISILGVLKSGATFLPTSSLISNKRMADLVTRIQPKLALTSNTACTLTLSDSVRAVDVQALVGPLGRLTHNSFEAITALPTDPAIILFTSGSTGAPKGIQWNHQTLSSNVHTASIALGLHKGSRVFQFAAYEFDVSSVETLAVLSAGGCLCIPAESDRSGRLEGAISDACANWVCLTPSVSELLEPSRVPSLRTLVLTGEKLMSKTAFKWTESVDSVYNWYGPAEASVATTCLIEPESWTSGLIGTSVSAKTWLVDPKDRDRLSPLGAIAELCVEGTIVADGYIDEDASPADNRAFFFPQWLRVGHGEISGREGRVYQTGDLVSCDAEGRLVYLHRSKDSERKLRGQRIDLETIEQKAQAFLSGTIDAVVVAEIFSPARGSQETLALFIKPANLSSSDAEAAVDIIKAHILPDEVEAEMAVSLPLHMVPKTYVPVSQIPMTATGKIDRSRLRLTGSSLTQQQLAAMQPARRRVRSPSTAMETELQRLWSTVLHIPRESIYADDSFLRIGGDSISAMRLVATARDHGFDLTVAEVFESSRLSQMAAVVRHSQAEYEPDVPPFSLLNSIISPTAARSNAARLCGVADAQVLDAYPCTALQEGLLAITSRNHGQYVSRSVFEFQEEVDIHRFQLAWRATAEKLPILRTRIVDIPDQGLTQVELRDAILHTSDDLGAYVHNEEREQMGLGMPLCRAGIVDRKFVFTIHHSMYDGESLKMILEELESQYTGAPGLNVTPFQKFVRHLRSTSAQDAAEFWKKQLSSSELQPFPVLPSSTYRPVANEEMQRTIALAWPSTGFTRSTIIRSAWAILVAKYTHSNAIIFGATVSGRQIGMRGIESCVAPTISTVPVALQIDWDETVEGLQDRIQRQALDMVMYEQYGLQQIKLATQAPEFQTLIVIQPEDTGKGLRRDNLLFKARDSTLSLNLTTRGFDPFNSYAIMLVFELQSSGLHLKMSFDNGVVSGVQANRIYHQLETILRQLCTVAVGMKSLKQIETISAPDLEFHWKGNTEPPQLPKDYSWCQMQLPSRLEATAICAWDGSFTYRQIQDFSNKIRVYLTDLGLQRGSVVLLWLKKSKWTPILQLAVLKSGAVCLLQSAAVPEQRLRSVIQKSGTRFAIVSEALIDIAAKYAHTMSVDQILNMPVKAEAHTRHIAHHMNAPAAIIVSSGTTGVPKLVLWSQRTLAANVHAFSESIGLSNLSRVFQFTSYDFDVCTIETLATLNCMGCLCIPSETERLDELSQAISRYECNLACLTPSTTSMIRAEEVTGLTTLIFTGEKLFQEEAARWTRIPRTLNWYGPSEFASATFCNTGDDSWYTGVIQTTAHNTLARCWVIDPEDPNRLAPLGAVGELALEGPSSAECYLGDLELTARSFYRDPSFLSNGYEPTGKGRLGVIYRTGDLVRYDEYGKLVFVGRNDAMLKIRGQLVAPEEVEQTIRHCLAETGANRVAVVAIVPKCTRDVALAAFISTDVTGGDTQTEFKDMTGGLEEELARFLPSFSIPSIYIPISTIPMTSTGKIDRRRLRELGGAFEPSRKAYNKRYEPKSVAETALRQLWSHVLQVDIETISTADSFLKLGHSIHAMRLVGLARQHGLVLTVANIFRHPKLQDMAKVLSELEDSSEETVEPFSLLNLREKTRKARQTAAALCGVDEEDVEDLFPCTQVQEGLLALSTKQQGDYVGHDVLELVPSINVDQFMEAWEKTVSMIPILRTRIVELPGEGLVQATVRHKGSWTRLTDLNDYLAKEQIAHMGLNLPLIRYGILHGRADRRGQRTPDFFVLTMHHAIYDGMTTPLIFETLERIYHQETPFPLYSLQPLISYIKSINMEQETQFWKSQFEALEAPQFPLLPSTSYQPNPQSVLQHIIEGLSWGHERITATTIIRAAWGIICSSHSDSEDVVFGAVVTGRKATVIGIERIVGPTICTVPIRLKLDHHATLDQALSDIQDQETTMVQYEQTGIPKIRKISDEAYRACQFQSMIVVQAETARPDHGRIFASRDDRDGMGKPSRRLKEFNAYALMVICTFEGEILKVDFSFDSNVLDRSIIRCIAGQFEHLLGMICAADLSTARLCEIHPTAEQDLKQIWEWNSRSFKTSQACVHDLVMTVSKKKPEATAISAWDGELTYGELASYSTSVASHLIKLGVVSNTILPLCFEKSKWTPVALLGVMRAGGAGLLLDPSLPKSRLKAILSQVQPKLIVSSAANHELASELGSSVLLMESAVKPISDGNGSDDINVNGKLPKVQSSNLLYVIFTSGSTGDPKGCLIQHEQFSSAIMHQRDTLGFDQCSRVFDFSSYSFDASYWSSFHVLSAGGTLCIPCEADRKNNLTDVINRFRTTDLFLTPATARLIDPSDLTTLKNVFIGGEEVKRDDLNPWLASTKAWVVYGPTECSAISLYWNAPQTLPPKLPIGFGVGVATWIVDPRFPSKLAPIGGVGELYLEGPLVGQGYLLNEEKSAASFLDNPIWLQQGLTDGTISGRPGRVYATGDLVRYDPSDGSIIFLGRKDTQMKLRGQRLELSEVEHHIKNCLLRKMGLVQVAAEIVTLKATQRAALVAFIQHEGHDSINIRELADELDLELADLVPAYMIPSSYTVIESLPFTSGGKRDRKRLMKMGASLMADHQKNKPRRDDLIAASTDQERTLQRLWAALLGIPFSHIEPQSNFLRIGGDSVVAMRLAATVRSQGGVLTVQSILGKPRLSDMAAVMRPLQNGNVGLLLSTEPFSLLKNQKDLVKRLKTIASLCATDSSTIEDLYPCTGLQKSLMAMTAKQAESSIATFILDLRDEVDVQQLRQAWESVSKTVAPILRCRIVEMPGEGLVQVQLDESIEWNVSTHLDSYLSLDLSRPMGLGHRLTRLAITGTKKDRNLCCILTQHHAVYDATSLRLLVDEVAQAYTDISSIGRATPFQTFLSYAASIDENKVTAFWAREYEDCESVAFPALPRQDYQPMADCTITRNIKELDLTGRDVTTATVLKAAWALLSARYTDSSDIVFGVLVTGRQAEVDGIDRIIAPLISVVPVRVKLDEKDHVRRYLHRLQQQSTDMIPYEQTEISKIRQINADTNRGSRFTTLLLIQPASQSTCATHTDGPFQPGLKLRASSIGLDKFNPHALMVVCHLESPSEICLEMNFDSAVLSGHQVNRLGSQFECALRQICSQDIQQLKDINTTSIEDLADLWKWNSTVPGVVSNCVHDMVALTASRQPDAPAICSWDGELSYREMEKLASSLALQLTQLGVVIGSIVPLCFEKSMWMTIAALGAMKAGAICVAMDSTQPAERLRSIVDQVNPSLILTSAANEQLASGLLKGKAFVVDHAHLEVSSLTCFSLSIPQVQPTDVLYIVFTSGSTGLPKGVVTTHQNFASAAVHQAEALGVRRGTRVYDFVSYSFDVSWSNTLNTLICGGCLCVPSEWQRKNDIPKSFNRMKADYVYFTPSVARSLDPPTMPGLRMLAMGGEPIPSSEISRWHQAEAIIGIYGPAECAQALSIVSLTPESSNGHVGFPFGALTWLVQPGNPHQLAAIGTIGELLIEGPTVSQGYFNNSEQTNASFLYDPSWLAAGPSDRIGRAGRLYRTGDLLRYNSDGSLAFIGRKDGLIKLRGQRIELGEVEHHVRSSLRDPSLCAALAAEVILPQNANSSILVLFASLHSYQSGDDVLSAQSRLDDILQDVNEKLLNTVPQYMIPGACIHLNHIPTTTTNKTDRKKLRDIGSSYTLEQIARLQRKEEDAEVPLTIMEASLQALWASILGIEYASIGANSHFLKIGGESIAAMRLVAAARQVGLHFTVADVFKAPRLSDLAQIVRRDGSHEEHVPDYTPFSLLERQEQDQLLEDISHSGIDEQTVEDILPTTDFQECAIKDALQDPPSRFPHWILDLPVSADMKKLRSACEQLVQRFSILRTVFVFAQDRYWQVVLTRLEPTFEFFQATDEGMLVQTSIICAKDLERPRQLGQSFVRFMSIQSDSGHSRLIFRLSHAQFDGFSLAPLFSALSSLYYDVQPEEPLSFGQLIAFRGYKRKDSIDYWQSRLNGVSFPEWSTSNSEICIYGVKDRLTSKRTIKIPDTQRQRGISIATRFHAASILALALYFKQSEVVLGRLVTGRSMLPVGLQSIIGPCLTEIPIRIQVKSGDTVEGIALHLHHQFIEDSMHEAAGMADIIRHGTDWPNHAEDFGWRTAFQQENADSTPFLGGGGNLSFYERDLLPRTRPEIYATPRGGYLDVEFEGNRRLISANAVDKILDHLQALLSES